ncbi:hypothetical protein ACI2OX_11970 [Bacillus sp. N9]
MDQYHQKMTEDALAPLFDDFQDWKNGKLPYWELTERIHEFHKENQQIWKTFNYNGLNDEWLLIQAKRNYNC